ncbi:MAG: hypoxanthine phosphoribosyltransferase [Bacteroidota bacterium]
MGQETTDLNYENNPEAYVICRGERFRPFLTEAQIKERIQKLGEEISQEYEGKEPILIGLLNGAFMFIADLMREIRIDCEVDFFKLSSYGAEKVSSGKVQELKSVDAKLKDRHVIVVDDIVDTGLTMQYILNRIKEYEPASVRVATFLHKPDSTQHELTLDYVGFEIPSKFVLGYGLDYDQLGRNLSMLYVLDD